MSDDCICTRTQHLDTIAAQLLDERLAAFDADLARILGTIESKIESARSAA